MDPPANWMAELYELNSAVVYRVCQRLLTPPLLQQAQSTVNGVITGVLPAPSQLLPTALPVPTPSGLLPHLPLITSG